MKKYTLYIIALFCCTMLSCEKHIMGVQYENTPVDNFEAFWTEFDQMYGLFRIKNVDWGEVYDQYRPMVNNETSDEALYEIFIEILRLLDDGHVMFLPVGTDMPMYRGGPAGRTDTTHDFNFDLLKTHYLSDPHETDFAIVYGWLEEGIGYLYFKNFADGAKAFEKEMEPVVDFFKDAKGLVVDIRGEGGGEDIAGKTVASYFADERRMYMTTAIKNGPGPNDFTEPEEWFIEPAGTRLDQPVILLTQRLTISARETFGLAMRTLPQVRTVGDTTAGAFSNLMLRELPNGWGYSMSIGEWRAADGTSYEGKGLPPDLLVQNRRSDLLNGTDSALEKAIELLR